MSVAHSLVLYFGVALVTGYMYVHMAVDVKYELNVQSLWNIWMCLLVSGHKQEYTCIHNAIMLVWSSLMFALIKLTHNA